MSETQVDIQPEMNMQQILDTVPAAQRALFQRYHIGGCSSCAYQPTDTLAQVCKDHNLLDVNDVVRTILLAHETDQNMQVPPQTVKEWIDGGELDRFLDVRTPDELAKASIPGAEALDFNDSEKYMQLPKDTKMVFFCAPFRDLVLNSISTTPLPPGGIGSSVYSATVQPQLVFTFEMTSSASPSFTISNSCFTTSPSKTVPNSNLGDATTSFAYSPFGSIATGFGADFAAFFFGFGLDAAFSGDSPDVRSVVSRSRVSGCDVAGWDEDESSGWDDPASTGADAVTSPAGGGRTMPDAQNATRKLRIATGGP